MYLNDHWSRIDLHQHTNHDREVSGKKIISEYTHEDYYELLDSQEVKLKAVTCHNNIDIAEHVKHAIIANLLNINHLVGVEIDYCFEEIKFHAITILSPNVNIIKYTNLLNDKMDNNGGIPFSKKDFNELHVETEFIFIPHGIKDKGILNQSIEDIEASTIDWVIKSLISGLSMPILFENTRDFHIYSVSEKIYKVLKNHAESLDITAYVGSDYKFDRDKTRKKTIQMKPTYSIFSQPTYRGLEIALRNANSRISMDSQIINREKFIKRIKINECKYFEDAILALSPGLNVIIGDSGSGKTLLLNQIYYQLKGAPLKAALKTDNAKQIDNPYKDKVGSKNLLNIEFEKEYKNLNIEILEIPNIYSEILKTQENDDSVSKMFGLNKIDNASVILLDYKKRVDQYFNLLKSDKTLIENGMKNLTNLSSAIDFINKNKIDKPIFLLKEESFNNEELVKLQNKSTELEKIIQDENKIKQYFENIKSFLSSSEDHQLIETFIINYEKIILSVKNEKSKNQNRINNIHFEKKIIENINKCILDSNEMLGSKEKTLNLRRTTANTELMSLISCLKETIKNEIKEDSYNLTFPFDEIKSEIEKNCNEYARMSLNGNNFDIKEVDILENTLIDTTSIKTILKKNGIAKFDFSNNNHVKNVVRKLLLLDINLANIIKNIDDVPKNIELFIDENRGWRLIQNINKGDIAKKSIEYYFNNLIKISQPDIVLIDQPENDVDKRFITLTLSKFIREQKLDKQIIITSHDPIIAINSDVNKIIEAKISDNNKFTYLSYDLEYVIDEVYEATNRVSNLLDGGKTNIKKRYQIYGGELNYENNNY